MEYDHKATQHDHRDTENGHKVTTREIKKLID